MSEEARETIARMFGDGAGDATIDGPGTPPEAGEQADAGEAGDADEADAARTQASSGDIDWDNYYSLYYRDEYEGHYLISNNDNSEQYIMTIDSDLVANLGEIELSRLTDSSYIVDGYFRTKDQVYYNMDGEVVFSLADSEYDGIATTDPIDIGYLILTQEENTFENTATHYYAYNLADGSSYELTGAECYPTQSEYWYYFGNGNYVYAVPQSGWGNQHIIYHVQTGEMLQASYTTVEGEETDKLPDIYFWNRNYYDDEGMYGVEGDKRFVYNLVTGHAVATPVVDGAYGVKVEKDYDYQGDYMAISYTDAAGTYHNALLDLPTGVVTPMDDYQSFDVHTQDSDGNYLCVVRNEGGGVFVVVVNADGSRRFEPVTISSTYGSSTQFWISSYESDTWSVYNWDGEEVAQFENPYTQPQTLEDRILYTVEEYDEETGTTGYSSYLINTETGEENEVPTAQNSTGEFTFQAHNVERARPEYYVAMQGYILTRDNEIVQFYIHK